VGICDGAKDDSGVGPVDMVLKVLGPRESCGVGVGAAKGADAELLSRLASAWPMDGKLCELSGEPAAEGVGACRAGKSRWFGGGMVYFPTLEVARLSCLGLPKGFKDRGGEVCLAAKIGSAKIGSWDTSSWNDGKEVLFRLGSSVIKSRAVLAATT
jgi:hypothetical protein